MRFLVLLMFLACVTGEERTHCYKQQQRECAKHGTGDMRKCTALYGGVSGNFRELQNLISLHLGQSVRFMQMASFFGTDHMHRIGFQKYFQKLSDDLWEDALELIQYTMRRGGRVEECIATKLSQLELSVPGGPKYREVTALSRALDIHKQLAEDVFNLHHLATKHRLTEEEVYRHDPELAHFLEEKFTKKHGDTIRDLAGHVTTLNSVLTFNEGDLGLYMYDNMLRDDQISGY